MDDWIPWDEFEVKYAKLFPSDIGNVAKPLRMALGTLIIQTKFQYSDCELVEQIAENPYLQYFIGLLDFREEALFDATCTSANIRYLQDILLLNEAREKLENIICRFCKCYSLKLPRRYRKCARKEYLAYAKSRKHTAKKISSTLRRQLAYVKGDFWYLEKFMSDGYAMTCKDINLYLIIIKMYEHQQYMYDNKAQSVEHRIVSNSQPRLQPIVRSKAGQTKRHSKSW